MNKKYFKIVFIIFVLILFDFLTKCLVTHLYNLNEGIVIIKNFLKFIYIKNTGAAFGLLNKHIIVLIIVTILITIYLIKELFTNKTKLYSLSYILIISGAIGNLIDRVFRGYVIDFISFTLFGHEMAIFNIADIYVTFGVILLIFNMIKEEINERNNSKK
jgi:signal peptidase II